MVYDKERKEFNDREKAKDMRLLHTDYIQYVRSFLNTYKALQ